MKSKLLALKSRLKGTSLGKYLRMRRWNAALLSRAGAEKVVDSYAEKCSPAEKEMLVADILDMARKYRFSAEEYFFYNFQNKTETERRNFCSDLNRIDVVESLNKPENLIIFDDKTITHQHFSKYYGRGFCGVKSKKDLPRLLQFAQEYRKFILKPTDSSCGQGVRMVDLSSQTDERAHLEQLIDTLCSGANGGFVAEEPIVQHPLLAQFHPASVNTIRIATIRCDDGVEFLGFYLKIGVGDNIVDNSGNRLVCALDFDTGKIVAAVDKCGINHTKHPETGVDLIGFTLPQWDEAKALAKELAQVIPGNRYTGWDLALTEKGWVMVEGNARGQFIGWQTALQKGCVDDLNRILKKLGRPAFFNSGIG